MEWSLTNLRPSEGIRWAVGEQAGRRSSTFRFWGNKKGDFYLSARSLGGSLKTSLHRDGRCHTGFTSDYAAKHAIVARHMDRWEVPLDRLVKAVQVMVADTDLAAFPSDDKDPMRWLRAPRPGNIAIVGIVILPTIQAGSLGNSWPGAEVGTEPVGLIATSKRTAFVLHWENALEGQQESDLRGLRERVSSDAAGNGIAPSPGIRAVLIGQVGDGEAATRSLIDIAHQGAA